MKKAYPPGPAGYPLVGNLPQIQSNRLKLLVDNRDRFGDMVYMRMANRDLYQLNHPEYIQYVLVKGAEKFHKSPMLKRITGPLLGQGLLTSEDDFHRQQRKLVQPAFHHHRISSYADVMVNLTVQMLDSWQSGMEPDAHEAMMNLTMAIVARTLFDTDVTSDATAIGEAISFAIADASQNMTRPLQLPGWLPTPRNRQRSQTQTLLKSAIMNIIDERRRSGEDRGDLLSMLLLAQDEDSGAQLSDQQVHDEAMTLFIAGHETTANALSWALYLLSLHPQVEAKLLDELQAVLGGRVPTMADLRQLTYTDMVIKETMRLYPPAWMITRIAKEDVEIGGYAVVAGSIVLVSQYVMHHHPYYWERPEEFQPERFAEEWDQSIPKFAYFPFGGGPRVCIGNSFAMMEATLVLATIMQRYHLSLAPGQTIEMEPLITLRPKGKMRMIASEREVLTANL